MIWLFLLAVALAVVFIKLGALSVWVGIFKGAFQIVAFIVMGLLCYQTDSTGLVNRTHARQLFPKTSGN